LRCSEFDLEFILEEVNMASRRVETKEENKRNSIFQ